MNIGWARVSTADQSLDAQVEKLKAAGCEKIFESKHSGKGSGKNKDKLQEMIDWVREGDTVICTKLDRLGRSLKEVLNTVDQLREKGVVFKCIDQNISSDKNDPMSNAMMQMLGVFAEMERSFIAERTKAGREATGNFGGRPKKLNEKQKELIRQKAEMGIPKAHIAREFNVSATTVNRVLDSKPEFSLKHSE